jgi:ABC-type antimicrobial peptide transport system permease subunit
VYTAYNQIPDSDIFVTLRTSNSNENLLRSMAKVIHQIDSRIVADGADTMQSRINHTPSAYLHRAAAWIVAGFASLALLLGSVGTYGVVSYSVGQRTREMGVRMALGAQRGSIYRMVLMEGGRLVVIGTLGGLVCSFVVTRLLRSLLFGISRWDAGTLVAVTVILVSAALAASYVPARRAASIDPAKALRAE